MSLQNEISKKAGFTLVELIVTVGIFVFMTALVVAKYGSFNDGTLLTSMAYDVALAMRDAQSYGLNVQGYNSTNSFNNPYGMDFNQANPGQMILFADINANKIYDSVDQPPETTYTLARGGLIKCLYVSNNPITNTNSCLSSGVAKASIIDVTFKRPNPNAIITENDAIGVTYAYAEIQVEDASKASTRSIVVNETGEIAIQNQ